MSNLIKLKQTVPYNFDSVELIKQKKLLFIHYTTAKIKIENDLCSDNNIDIMYIQYKKDLDANKIISWLNNNFDYITIILERAIKDNEFDKLLSYCEFIKNKKSIIIMYRYNFKKKFNLDKLNKEINQKLIIPFKYTSDPYIVKYDNILSVPITYIYTIKDTKTPPVAIFETILSETWFYQYIINKFYSCATGRLRQISGTCYANAVLNCVLLSNPLKALFFMKLKNDIKKQENLIDFIKQKLDKDCPSNSKLFIYRFLYNLMCTDYKPTIKSKYKDIISNPDNIMTQLTKHVLNKISDGYYPEIFSDNLFIDIFGDLYHTKYRDIYDVSIYDKGKLYFPLKSYLKHPKNKEKCVKIIYYNYAKYNIKTEFDEISEINGYTPIACIISAVSDKSEYHAICGYICDGEYIIYDSATNYIVRYNWLSSKKMKNFTIKTSFNNILKFNSYVNCYYIKNSYIKELEEYSICPML